jgi:hypothetical protein
MIGRELRTPCVVSVCVRFSCVCVCVCVCSLLFCPGADRSAFLNVGRTVLRTLHRFFVAHCGRWHPTVMLMPARRISPCSFQSICMSYTFYLSEVVAGAATCHLNLTCSLFAIRIMLPLVSGRTHTCVLRESSCEYVPSSSRGLFRVASCMWHVCF